MEKEFYKSFDELPIMLSVNQLANVLGISRTSSYDLVRSKGFPSITIGSRIVVPKDELMIWIQSQLNSIIDKINSFNKQYKVACSAPCRVPMSWRQGIEGKKIKANMFNLSVVAS